MSPHRVSPIQRRSVHHRCCIDVSHRAGESLASPAGQNMKKSTLELCENDVSISPEDRAQSLRSPKQIATIEADPK